LPLQLAGMGGIGSAALARAVSSAGGLGMVPSYIEPPTDAGPVGINFLLPWGLDVAAVHAAANRCRVVEFFCDWPSTEALEAVHATRALGAWQVGSVEEALAAEHAGCDFVVVQGTEAGGHVRGELSLMELLPNVVEEIAIPVVAAGGIATSEHVREVIALGADAVRVGTLFVATRESNAHPDYVRRLVEARGPEDTVLTTHFDEGWPDAPHRVLRTALEEALERDYHGPSPPSQAEEGPVGFKALYAGCGVAQVREVRSATEVVHELMASLD
jgi:nitronate monooxygenase